jgi:hypothetical protein
MKVSRRGLGRVISEGVISCGLVERARGTKVAL